MELPIGHEPDNWTLPLGVRARLDAARGTLELLEPAVA
jgi:muramoyltetrapeptide carboxypeptidase LdcA involved in peptidoglycan recycling